MKTMQEKLDSIKRYDGQLFISNTDYDLGDLDAYGYIPVQVNVTFNKDEIRGSQTFTRLFYEPAFDSRNNVKEEYMIDPEMQNDSELVGVDVYEECDECGLPIEIYPPNCEQGPEKFCTCDHAMIDSNRKDDEELRASENY